MYNIGLTGGIGSGKSYILEVLREAGCFTLRADDVAKKILFSEDSNIKKSIREIFGNEIIREDESINKELLSQEIFRDEKKRRVLNHIIHPKVAEEREKMFQEIEKTGVYQIFVYESALLLETGIHKKFDKIIVVYTTESERLKRLRERDNISEEKAKEIINTQFPLSEKLKIANYTIDTTGDYTITRARTLETLHLIAKDFKLG